MSRKATITNVEQVRDYFIVQYDSGTEKRMLTTKAPKTVLSWLEAHADEQTTEEPTVEAAADLETVTESEPEKEVFKEDEVEGKVEGETERETEQHAAAIPAAAELPEEDEPQPEPLKATEDAEPVEASSPEPETVTESQRKPQQTVQSGTWPTVAEMVKVVALRTAQLAVFTIWLMIQIAIASIRLAESIPATIQRARTTCRAVITDMARAYQKATGAARTALKVTVEIITDTGHGIQRYSKVIRAGAITLLSNIR